VCRDRSSSTAARGNHDDDYKRNDPFDDMPHFPATLLSGNNSGLRGHHQGLVKKPMCGKNEQPEIDKLRVLSRRETMTVFGGWIDCFAVYAQLIKFDSALIRGTL
jgi:hypothetical protein